MRSIVELRNIHKRDGTIRHIKFYLENNKIVKYDTVHLAPFFGEMAILSRDIDDLSLNRLLKLALREVKAKKNIDNLENLYIEKDLTGEICD